MSNLKDFKPIADEVMSELNVSEELKQKTLFRCGKKRKQPLQVLVPAACLVLIFTIVNLSGILPLETPIDKEKNPEVNLLIDREKEPGIFSEPSVENPIEGHESFETWQLESAAEAEKTFGAAFLAPTYVPQSFELEQISASGSKKGGATKIVLSYLAGEQAFLVIEEKDDLQVGFTNYKDIEINGVIGHLKGAETTEGESTVYLDTELHWFKDGVHYAVMGQITEQQAIFIAESMK